jgi:cysteine desulfurase
MREMKGYSSSEYANPSSLYKEGVAAKKAVESARNRVGSFLNAHGDEIVFTSGGTEANALALEGVLKLSHKNGIDKPHLIISAIEHSSIMETANMLEKCGIEVTRLGVDSHGLISLDELKKAIKPSTYLISIMTVNNEIGTIQPIREIAKAVRQWRKGIGDRVEGIEKTYTLHPTPFPLLHTDASQAALFNDLNVEKLGVDLLTLDSSKVYGPRGIGALFVRRGTPIEPIIHGGGQERGLRSGTENVPAIMGFAKALEIASTDRDGEVKRISQLRDHFLKGFLNIRQEIKVNPDIQISQSQDHENKRVVGSMVEARFQSFASEGHLSTPLLKSDGKSVTFAKSQKRQSPHILNVSIPGIDNEVFVLRLDAGGVACSTKSSCLRDADESYVLKAIGADLPAGRHGSKTSIRFSFGRWTKKADLDKALAVIAKALKV